MATTLFVSALWLRMPAVAAAAASESSPAAPSDSGSASDMLLLQVFVNGHDTGKIGEFTQRNGTLFIKPDELDDLGFRLPAGPLPGDGLVPLRSLPGLQYRLDQRTQTIQVTAPNGILKPELLFAGATAGPPIPVESGIGATLNYDLVGTSSAGQNALGGQFDLRGFSPWGVGSTSFLVSPQQSAMQTGYKAVRLDSTWTVSDPDTLTRYRAGDFINGGLGWSRPVRMAGIQYGQDFSLRPDLVTIPLPQLSGTAAVPSTVDVLVNGVKVFTGQAQPGPFVIPQLPVVSGASNLSLAVTDALGRQVVTTLPFYTAGGLLANGLQTSSVEAGLIRLNYATESNDYTSPALSGTWRRGLSDTLTVEAHGEASKDVAMVGGGGVMNLLNAAVLNLDLAGSSSSGRQALLATAGISRSARPITLSLSATWAQPNFRDIAAVNFQPVPRLQLNAGIGFELGRFGSLSASYNSADLPAVLVNNYSQPAQRTRLLSASYSLQYGPVALTANAFEDLLSHGTGVMVGLTIPLGTRSSVTTSGAIDAGRAYGELESSQSATEVGEFGYQAYAAEGSQSHEFGNVQYASPWAFLTAGVDHTNGIATFRGEAQGAISAIDGGVFPSPPIRDAFAVVDTSGLAGVDVLRENRIVGQTDSNGRIFVPDLRSFEVNHLAIDPNDVPPDTDLTSVARDVRPQDRTGVVVPFQIQRSNGAVLRLVHEDKTPIAFGSAGTLHANAAPVPVGYDGEAFVEGLAQHNEFSVTEPSGKRCVAKFDYTPMPGDIPEIGPVLCQAEMQ
ncbi:MAG TPA: fimbria/pilus outer membrane usher protein [Micropepsaceae bacterium]|nr:fimbria/pilus outer membrane usher protein [Micropepsaceae bacterium]